MQLSSATLLLDDVSGWTAGFADSCPEVVERTAKLPDRCEHCAELVPGWDDREWIDRVQEGDEDAARAMVQRLYPTVIKSVRYHLPKKTAEEDLVQAVFMKIFKSLNQYSGLVPLEHWVSRITVNTCINQLKHERVRPELRMSDLSEEAEAAVERLVFTDDALPNEQRAAARELVNALLARLKPEERLVITLLHLEERSVKEVSRLTGWSASLVKVRAFRARNRMRGIWREMFKEGD